jgi:hypothetical protein
MPHPGRQLISWQCKVILIAVLAFWDPFLNCLFFLDGFLPEDSSLRAVHQAAAPNLDQLGQIRKLAFAPLLSI